MLSNSLPFSDSDFSHEAFVFCSSSVIPKNEAKKHQTETEYFFSSPPWMFTTFNHHKELRLMLSNFKNPPPVCVRVMAGWGCNHIREQKAHWYTILLCWTCDNTHQSTPILVANFVLGRGPMQATTCKITLKHWNVLSVIGILVSEA